jgi:hypothetical protein
MIHLDNYVDLKARSGYITLCDDCVKMLQDQVWPPSGIQIDPVILVRDKPLAERCELCREC